MKKEKLEIELNEVRSRLEDLEAILKKTIEDDQHNAINQLEENFDAVESKFRGLREFWKTITSESKES